QAGLARCQREAEEVTELMKQNFVRVLERDGRLSDLDSRAQELRAMVGTYGHLWGRIAPGTHAHTEPW
ncbi:VAMP5 protein, partial [Scopus umbretta]|nr:VAMP5 protein [Scopus umbretta]